MTELTPEVLAGRLKLSAAEMWETSPLVAMDMLAASDALRAAAEREAAARKRVEEPTPEVVDRVAEVLYEQDVDRRLGNTMWDFTRPIPYWNGIDETEKNTFRFTARAVLSALSPTEQEKG